MSTMGEFCGWNTAPDPSADAYFRAAAKERQPTLSEVIDGTETVCGLRPYSNDGIGQFIFYPNRWIKLNNSVGLGPWW